MAEADFRRQGIANAIIAELDRQGHGDAGIDVDALAVAVDAALEPPAPEGEGKRPDELNANNDG